MQDCKPRETMRARQAIRPCPGCAAQAVLTAALREEIARLQTEVAQLQAQLSQTSANSHKPPFSDPPSRARVRVRELSTRQGGGQPGHPGTTRPLRPISAVDELHVCQPTHCVGCGSPLRGRDPSPLRHQVTELPPLKPTGCNPHPQSSQPQGLGSDRSPFVARTATPLPVRCIPLPS
jgi:Family of unknown function (DUF6444)